MPEDSKDWRNPRLWRAAEGPFHAQQSAARPERFDVDQGAKGYNPLTMRPRGPNHTGEAINGTFGQ